jgi:hypothetical protein
VHNNHNGVIITKRREIIFGYKIYTFKVTCLMCPHNSTHDTLAIARDAQREHATIHILGQAPLLNLPA